MRYARAMRHALLLAPLAKLAPSAIGVYGVGLNFAI
jgi:hypothetical protein